MATDALLAVLGGALIGLSASLLFVLFGRVAGISGILFGLFSEAGPERRWRMLFAIGLFGGGAASLLLWPTQFGAPITGGVVRSVIAGLSVGLGTRLANGCTSGHGVCGISAGSKRSILATCTFMTTAILTVLLMRLGEFTR